MLKSNVRCANFLYASQQFLLMSVVPISVKVYMAKILTPKLVLHRMIICNNIVKTARAVISAHNIICWDSLWTRHHHMLQFSFH